jgi:hypothetical protein
MKDKDLYQGFAPEKQAGHEAWLVDRHGHAAQRRDRPRQGRDEGLEGRLTSPALKAEGGGHREPTLAEGPVGTGLPPDSVRP